MRLKKGTNWWVAPAIFFPVFAVACVVRGFNTGAWISPAWALSICGWVLLCWIVSLFIFRDRYFTNDPRP